MLNTGNILRLVGDICFAGSVGGCFYLLIASVLVCRFRSAKPNTALTTPVTVLVPLCGTEPDLHRRLSILCSQNYSAPVQIICGSIDIADPAIDVVRQAKTIHPHHSIEFHIDTRVHGVNLKISNLINMARHARHNTLVMIDSDIEISSNHLTKMITALERPGVGAVTCLYKGVAGTGFWTRLAALRINTDFLPSVVVGTVFSLAQPCFGASIAISRMTLERVGGFNTFVDQLWDDYAIGAAVREIGYEVAIAPFVVSHIYTAQTMREWLANELRAVRTIRCIDPIGYVGSIITYPLPLALIASITHGEHAIALASAAVACRTVLGLSVKHRFRTCLDNVILLPLRELISFVIYITSFVGASVVWRGQYYRLPRRPVIANPR
jgi:ceramide glucosyltransferase